MFKFKRQPTHNRVIFGCLLWNSNVIPSVFFFSWPFNSSRSLSLCLFVSLSRTRASKLDSIYVLCVMFAVFQIQTAKAKRRRRKIEWAEHDSATERIEEKRNGCVQKPSQSKPSQAEKSASKYCMCAQRLSEKATKPNLPPLTASLLLHGKGLRSH